MTMQSLGVNQSIAYSGYDDYSPTLECRVQLKNRDMWKMFHVHGTEMIITKSGRRMFPAVNIQVQDLSPNTLYCIILEMEQPHRHRFKYSSTGGWFPAGSEDARSPQRFYVHPESPARGDYWMSQPICFDKVKLTNTFAPPAGRVALSSMHKYQPKIIIAQVADLRELNWAPKAIIKFAETQFIAVTAYQNEKVTKLKIDHNPFAKGFRENGKAKNKKKKTRQANIENLDEITVVDDSSSSDKSDRVSPSSSSSNSSLPIACEISQPHIGTFPYPRSFICDRRSSSSSYATSTPSPTYEQPTEHSPLVQRYPVYPYTYYHPYPVYMPTMWSSNTVLYPPIMPIPSYAPVTVLSPTSSETSQLSPIEPERTQPEPMQTQQFAGTQLQATQSEPIQTLTKQFKPVPSASKLTDFSIRAITGFTD